MSPHAAKARGIFDRGASAAPIGGGNEMGGAQPTDENDDALLAEASLFDAAGGGSEGDLGGVAPGDEDLAMAWSGSRLVRSASMSSTGSADAEESEVRPGSFSRPMLGLLVCSCIGQPSEVRSVLSPQKFRNFYCFTKRHSTAVGK